MGGRGREVEWPTVGSAMDLSAILVYEMKKRGKRELGVGKVEREMSKPRGKQIALFKATTDTSDAISSHEDMSLGSYEPFILVGRPVGRYRWETNACKSLGPLLCNRTQKKSENWSNYPFFSDEGRESQMMSASVIGDAKTRGPPITQFFNLRPPCWAVSYSRSCSC
jgi:hypothetical protein